MNRKRWYISGLGAAVLFAAACSSLDHVSSSNTYDHFWEPLAIGLLLMCFLMLIAGIAWSRVGERPHVVGFSIFGVFVPILVLVALGIFGLGPNIHGSYVLFFLFELFSLLTMAAMLLGTFLRKKTKNA